MILWYWAVRALPAALVGSTIVRAQEAPTLAAGTQVRAIVPRTANAADPLRCESRDVQAARDTLLLSALARARSGHTTARSAFCLSTTAPDGGTLPSGLRVEPRSAESSRDSSLVMPAPTTHATFGLPLAS